MEDAKDLEGVDETSRLNTGSEKIKFQPSSNGEAKIEIPDSSSAGLQCGLTKEELMKYANDPFWIFIRRLLLVLFWLLWIAMLVGAIVIIVVTPKCAAPKEREWYESSPFYAVRVDEFAHPNTTQRNNLSGLVKNTSYFQEISVSSIIIENLFNIKEPGIINPDIGSKEDFRELAGLVKVIISFPVNRFRLNTVADQRALLTGMNMWLKEGAAGFLYDGYEFVNGDKQAMELLVPIFKMVTDYSTPEFPRINILSSYQPTTRNYCLEETQMVMQYELARLDYNYSMDAFYDVFDKASGNDTACRKVYATSTGDVQPLVNRFRGHERDRIIIFLMMSDLTPSIYFGDEYGKDDTDLPDGLDRLSQKIPKAFEWSIVDDLRKQTGNNFFKVFKSVAKLRRNEYAIRMGDTFFKRYDLEGVVVMVRVKKGNPGFIVVTNFLGESVTVDLTSAHPQVPDTGDIVASSSNVEVTKKKAFLKKYSISGDGTVVIQFVPA